VVDVRRAAAAVKVLREAGQVAVFTNGCFDLLHAGHLATLEAARRLGDMLVVPLIRTPVCERSRDWIDQSNVSMFGRRSWRRWVASI
jgi:cytidyltransferase-like protein